MDKNYILIIGWVAVMAMLSVLTSVKREETVCGKKEYRWRPVWAVVTFLPLIIWCGNRGANVGDTVAYMDGFAKMPESFGSIGSYIETIEKDRGFYFLSAVIKCIVGNHVNGIRQFLAVTITFIGIKFILDKKYAKAIILILIASLMHQSALLVIPFIFIAQGKAWNKKTLLFMIVVIVAVAGIGQFTNVLDSMLAETQYKNVVSDWQSWNDDGTNVLRVLVYAVPSILALIGLRFIRNEDDKVINLCTNMSIVSVGFYIVSMFTSGIFIGRLPIYFSLYSYILLPWEIDHMFTKRSARLVYTVMVIGYLGFYLYSMLGYFG